VDFRNLIVASKKHYYPLLNMENMLYRITGLEMFSFLDGFSSYNQVFVNKDDRHKTTFTTSWGSYEYLRIPFGQINAGATF
jgi:hypothetical protein